jgi:hypothetical protein
MGSSKFEGLPAFSRFKNGNFCPNCKQLTEHTKSGTSISCSVCGLKKSLLPKLTEKQIADSLRRKKEYFAFYSSITHYSALIEIWAVGPRLNRRKYRRFLSLNYWVEFRNKILFPSHDGETKMSKTKFNPKNRRVVSRFKDSTTKKLVMDVSKLWRLVLIDNHQR